MNSEKQRAWRGFTHDPWDCCGKEAGPRGRRKGTICPECKDLIQDGKAARLRLRSGDRLDVFAWTKTNYSWPAFYGTGAQLPTDVHDRAKRAFWTLVNLITIPAPADTPYRQPGEDGGEWPKFLSAGGSHNWDHGWRTLILAQPALQAAVDEAYQAIREALAAAYQAGKERGSSVLFGLASGEVSLNDFNEATTEPKGDR